MTTPPFDSLNASGGFELASAPFAKSFVELDALAVDRFVLARTDNDTVLRFVRVRATNESDAYCSLSAHNQTRRGEAYFDDPTDLASWRPVEDCTRTSGNTREVVIRLCQTRMSCLSNATRSRCQSTPLFLQSTRSFSATLALHERAAAAVVSVERLGDGKLVSVGIALHDPPPTLPVAQVIGCDGGALDVACGRSESMLLGAGEARVMVTLNDPSTTSFFLYMPGLLRLELFAPLHVEQNITTVAPEDDVTLALASFVNVSLANGLHRAPARGAQPPPLLRVRA